jgi:hypothetical protein
MRYAQLLKLSCAVLIVLTACAPLMPQTSGGNGSSKGGAGGAGNSGGDSSGSDKGGGKGSGSGSGQSGKGGNGTGGSGSAQGGSNAPFESQMMAYGAADQIALAIAKSVCTEVKGKKSTIIVYDSASFSSIQAYGGFEADLSILLAAYNKLKSDITGKEAAPGILEVASLILQYAGASTVENASNFAVSDDAIKMAIVHYLMASDKKAGCDRAMLSLVYPPVAMQLSASKGALADIAAKLSNLAKAKSEVGGLIASAKKDPNDPVVLKFQDTNKAYDQFIASLYTKDSNSGQLGIASVLTGHDLYNLVHTADTYILFEEAVAGGGTQRIRKNLFTNVFWGDLIRYSGGAVVTFALVDGPTSSISIASTLRFRTPNTTMKKSDKSKISEARAGDNL